MNQTRRPLPRLLLFIFAAVVIGAGEAQAKRVPKLYTFGPANSEIGPIKKEALKALPAEMRTQLEALRVDTVGFHYQHFGLFWLDIWSWGGRWTVYNKMNEMYLEATPSEAAEFLGIRESELKKPLSYHLPWGLVIIIGLALLKFLPRFLARRKQAAAVPQYQQSAAPPLSQGPPASGPPPIPPPLPPEQP